MHDYAWSFADAQLEPPNWGLDRIDQRDLPLDSSYTYHRTGLNVRAYLVDTGIRFSHTDFRGRATSGFDAIDGGTADDCHGHGTHVAGIAGGGFHGAAKQVELVVVRVLDCAGAGSTSSVTAGVHWVTENALKPAVANMSLGGPPSRMIDLAVQNSIQKVVSPM